MIFATLKLAYTPHMLYV